ncbi:MAG: tRNA (adenosine(37)-N6)-dimethylallyltransferase MiaA [Deltaproteobacteria bacterium RIFOXYA12_FULL_58_15]|nr:MAG: tRNA (adenosine(37)-N6)-dimethylallyltransferase MiaA [Deltaproteobacteria bacterium RIFOXYA12_FULL_58_15]
MAEGREKTENRILAVVGPTASGKTGAAMHAALRVGGEIISCDSVQVYRGFAIGCAKPTALEQRQVPHHLIDVVGFDEPFDAQRFRELAHAAIDDIRRRGKTPVLCGGTGLYLRTLRWGLVDAPPANEELRRRLMAQESETPGALYQRLQEVDWVTAQSTEPRNLVHIIRALEIHAHTGEPASILRSRHGFARELVPMRVVLLHRASNILRQRIVRRTEQMLAQGLLDEVSGLLKQGVPVDCRPMQSVGYREAASVVLGNEPVIGLAERIVHSTWVYARRQRTWFRRERDVEYIDADDEQTLINLQP